MVDPREDGSRNKQDREDTAVDAVVDATTAEAEAQEDMASESGGVPRRRGEALPCLSG
jgi:hypothetical protein